ncbi:MAG TPA: hypothetical protein PJ986_10560 [Gammaproteobacteria bacterium]|nr:hypothetical protein [Gammaproteobacteria bacterium]
MIEHGHRKTEIPDYTLDELEGYLDAVRRRATERQLEYLNLTALAAQGNGKNIEQLAKQLIADLNGREHG